MHNLSEDLVGGLLHACELISVYCLHKLVLLYHCKNGANEWNGKRKYKVFLLPFPNIWLQEKKRDGLSAPYRALPNSIMPGQNMS